MSTRNQIRTRRLALRVSQIALARGAQMSRYRLSMFECGYRSLSKTELAKIKAALDKFGAESRRGNANA